MAIRRITTHEAHMSRLHVSSNAARVQCNVYMSQAETTCETIRECIRVTQKR